MTTATSAPAAEQSAAPATGELSLQDAYAMIDAGAVNETFEIDNEIVKKPTDKTNEEPARTQEPQRAAQQESASDEEDAAQPEEAATSDETDENAPAEKPSRELPRSWTKEWNERWAKLDPDLQDFLLEQDSKASKAVRQSQNEIAEQRKAVEAERQAMQVVKQQYEANLPNLVKELEDINNTQFSLIKSQADLDTLATEAQRLAREGDVQGSQQISAYLQAWQLHQVKLQARTAELNQIKQRDEGERSTKFATFAKEQDDKFAASLSDKDQAKFKDYMANAPKFLEDIGYTQQELADLWNGNNTFRDHRNQAILLKAMKYDELMKAPQAIAAKPVPPVQKPGSANAASPQDANIRTLEQRLNKSGSMEDAWALYEAQLKQSNRRAS